MNKIMSVLLTLVPQRLNVDRVNNLYCRITYVWLGRLFEIKVNGVF